MKSVKFSNGTRIIQDENGKFKKILPKAESFKQTMPPDVEEYVNEGSEGVPRDTSVGLDQTDSDYEVYEHDYELGDSGSDANIVPRKNPSLKGQKATEFEEEKASELSSKTNGNYQPGKENEAPSKAGSPDNHVASSISKLKKELAETKQELQKEKTLRKREAIARRTIELEIQAGVLNDVDDEKFEQEVLSRISNSSDLLKKDYERVKSIYAMMTTGVLNKLAQNFNNPSNELTKLSSSVGIQKLDSYPEYLNDIHSGKYGTTIETGVPALSNTINNYSKREALLNATSQTTLSRKFVK